MFAWENVWTQKAADVCLSPHDWKAYLEHSQLPSECQGFLPGSASQLLKTYFPEGMSETLIRNILFGAVRGLSYLHQSGCIHRYWLVHIHTWAWGHQGEQLSVRKRRGNPGAHLTPVHTAVACWCACLSGRQGRWKLTRPDYELGFCCSFWGNDELLPLLSSWCHVSVSYNSPSPPYWSQAWRAPRTKHQLCALLDPFLIRD